MARRPNSEPDFDRDLADLPPELRWREWKARVEAVLFAAAKPVAREVLARIVGRDCALELLLDDLREDFRGRPMELVRAGESFALHTRPAFGPAIRAAFDIPADAKQLTKLEAGVLMAVAMFQPVTRGEISEMFGREISRDLIAALREEGLITAGPRSPKLGAPYAYVTTQKFLVEFGLAEAEIGDRPEWVSCRPIGRPVSNLKFQISGNMTVGLGRDRFAVRGPRRRFALLRGPHPGRRTKPALRTTVWSDRGGLDQANPSCFSWSAQTVGRERTSRVTVRSAGARPSAIAWMMRGER
jgi:segregation and condensation protein B